MTLNEKIKNFCNKTPEIDTGFIIAANEKGDASLHFIGKGDDEETSTDIGMLLSETMVQNDELASMLMATIPTVAEMFAELGDNEGLGAIYENVDYIKKQIKTTIQKKSN